jgi:predicted dehydrogenase
MNALIVGLGSIGRRHLANLAQVKPDVSATVWHQHATSADREQGSERHVFNVGDALKVRPEFALITGPANTHVETALELAGHGIHILVEKPLCDRLEGVDALLALCRERRCVLLVGYNYRFYAPLQAMRQAIIDGSIGRVLSVQAEVGQYLPDWRPGYDYRQGVSARRELGGGVVLELSHEIHYVRWLVGEITEVSARLGRVSDLDLDVEDIAEITLAFAGGAIGSIHLDMVQRTPTRTCKIVGTEGTLIWDGLTHHVRMYSSLSSRWTDVFAPSPLDRNETYLAELRHFLDCIAGTATPAVTGEDGRRVLEIALAARQSASESRVVTV